MIPDVWMRKLRVENFANLSYVTHCPSWPLEGGLTSWPGHSRPFHAALALNVSWPGHSRLFHAALALNVSYSCQLVLADALFRVLWALPEEPSLYCTQEGKLLIAEFFLSDKSKLGQCLMHWGVYFGHLILSWYLIIITHWADLFEEMTIR